MTMFKGSCGRKPLSRSCDPRLRADTAVDRHRGTGGVYYPMGGGLAEGSYNNNVDAIPPPPKSTGASVRNMCA